MRCFSCGHPNGAHARFCNGCGVSLTATAYAPPVQVARDAYADAEPAYAPAPYTPASYTPASYAPAPYAPPQPMVSGFAVAPDAGNAGFYPQGYAAPGGGYAPYPYPAGAAAPAPAPAAGPSLVNTVMVNQVAPTPAPPPLAQAPMVVADRHANGLTVVLSALFFLGGGIALGVLWVAASQGYNAGGAVAVVATITAVALLLYIMIVDRIARK